MEIHSASILTFYLATITCHGFFRYLNNIDIPWILIMEQYENSELFKTRLHFPSTFSIVKCLAFLSQPHSPTHPLMEDLSYSFMHVIKTFGREKRIARKISPDFEIIENCIGNFTDGAKSLVTIRPDRDATKKQFAYRS